ncbi:MAG: hypothetical protein IT306_24755 [Chloroflexi bacterium]|nr:hypothetical protein [Chloroflexota bacterium]
MAGSITVTTTQASNAIDKYSIAWVSDAAGAVSGNTFAVEAGELVQVRYIPDGGGTQPSAAYDVTMTDANGVDVLGGTGADLSQTASTVHVPAVNTYFRRTLEAGNLTPVVANAGNAKGGTIVLLVRRG